MKKIKLLIFLIQVYSVSSFSKPNNDFCQDSHKLILDSKNSIVTSNIVINESILNKSIEIFADTISKTKEGYFLGTKLISKRQLIETLKSNSESKKEYKKAEIWTYILLVPAVVGGAMVGYPLGLAAGGGDINAPVLGIGLGIVASTLITSALIESSAFKKSIKAYNKSISTK